MIDLRAWAKQSGAAEKGARRPRLCPATDDLQARAAGVRSVRHAPRRARPPAVAPSGAPPQGRARHEQPVEGDELRAIKRYLATRTDALPWLFLSERKQQIDRSSVAYIVKRAGERAGLGHVHPHMLRHSCGYYLANKGSDSRLIQDYLGHRDGNMTAHYTRTASHRFEGLW